jgi:hypothetical protein
LFQAIRDSRRALRDAGEASCQAFQQRLRLSPVRSGTEHLAAKGTSIALASAGSQADSHVPEVAAESHLQLASRRYVRDG